MTLLIQESDFGLIREHVTKQFGRLTESELSDLVAAAIDFLTKQPNIALDDDGLKVLGMRLRRYRQRERRGVVEPENSRTIQISNLARSEESTESEEERLGRLAPESHLPGDSDSAKLLLDLESSERELERWKSVLPPIEFEALKRMSVSSVRPHLTAGLTSRGVWIFYRRARIRMKWAALNHSIPNKSSV